VSAVLLFLTVQLYDVFVSSQMEAHQPMDFICVSAVLLCRVCSFSLLSSSMMTVQLLAPLASIPSGAHEDVDTSCSKPAPLTHKFSSLNGQADSCPSLIATSQAKEINCLAPPSSPCNRQLRPYMRP
jgi:hypothetical protein